jgi:uncharacterized protein YgiB involved in biofilm formation
MRQRRKRSAAITLVLAGSLYGCGDTETQRDVYTTLADCQRDWNAPAQCQPVNDGRYSSGYYYGPHYFGSNYPSGRPKPSASAIDATRTGHQSTTLAARSSPVSRGGFGSSSRSFSSSGS